MFKKQSIMLATLVLSALILSPSLRAQVVEPDEHGFMIAGPEQLLPGEGGRQVLIYGDPREPGIYVLQITWAPGTGSRPHYHNTARYINVLKGHWYVATGPESDVYAPDETTRVGPGTFIYEPPGGHHYDMAKDEEVVVQIFGMGPVSTTRIEE